MQKELNTNAKKFIPYITGLPSTLRPKKEHRIKNERFYDFTVKKKNAMLL
jgi:hypothetical protein